MTTHMKRVITAFVALPLLIGIIWLAPFWILTTVILVVALGGLYEFYRMLAPRGAKTIMLITCVLTIFLFGSLLYKGFFFITILPFFVMLPLAFFLLSKGENYPKSTDFTQAIIGPFYICLPLIFFLLIAQLDQGKTWIFFMLAVIFAGDTASFYAGRYVGKHKLTRISPGKTWEGTVGGLLANILTAGIFRLLFFPSLSLTSIVVIGIVMGISGQVGDLAESLLKRISNIKDSGTLLPGHGGILDRIDSLLFAVPVLYLYVAY
jgi:phosphatidate cytidylyltransferase